MPDRRRETVSLDEAELLAADIANLERADPAWLVERAVIGARAALRAGIADAHVEAAFGSTILRIAKAALAA
jgi:hypothetical protein